ncbi:hypothetical protein BDZ91DRAFT_737745 [Kalaharituber pfeilii]|nr:hypothetical protein BDZ91DRAFT_737745 [Kalaharituber pfeilii]
MHVFLVACSCLLCLWMGKEGLGLGLANSVLDFVCVAQIGLFRSGKRCTRGLDCSGSMWTALAKDRQKMADWDGLKILVIKDGRN